MRRVVCLIATLCVFMGLIAPTSAPATTPEDAAEAAAFVKRSGMQLRLAGRPFRFTGLNIYNANSVENCWYTMGEDTEESGMVLHRSLNHTGDGTEAFRAWFFQPLATRDGERDWAAFDHTLAEAREHNVKVIATLGNQWGECDGWDTPAAGYKSESWYARGYYSESSSPGMPTSYRRWVAEVVHRYKDDPTILAWQLVNEAEAKAFYDGPCADTASAALKGFARDMSTLVKTLDPNHLVSLGTIGSGQCGAAGAEYQDVHNVPQIDLCEYHDYQAGAMPGDAWNGLAMRLLQCSELGKPLFVGEIGIRTEQVATLPARASLLAAKLSAQFRAGVVGALAWTWRNALNGGSSTRGYEIGPGDPALDVLAAF